MKIPKSVKVGKTKIVIHQPDGLKLDKDVCRGAYYRSDDMIIVAKGNPERNALYKADDRANTFWHELTHAILHDMDNNLAFNEKFVSAFSDRLDQAVKTARF